MKIGTFVMIALLMIIAVFVAKNSGFAGLAVTSGGTCDVPMGMSCNTVDDCKAGVLSLGGTSAEMSNVERLGARITCDSAQCFLRGVPCK